MEKWFSVSRDGPRIVVDQLMRPPSSVVLKSILSFLWFLLHLVLSFVHIWTQLIQDLRCYIISCGIVPKYRDLQLSRLHSLAVVIDSVEAKDTEKIERLLCWLSTLGVKRVTLYDVEGVLKRTIQVGNVLAVNCAAPETTAFDSKTNPRSYLTDMQIEVLSYPDGKEGIVKAANFLCSNYSNDGTVLPDNKNERIFTEADMSSALTAVGSGGPEPDVMLIYGPARCHLGFPAWRLRYTEILHMGSLKSMKYGAILEAFYEFSKKHQNYGK